MNIKSGWTSECGEGKKCSGVRGWMKYAIKRRGRKLILNHKNIYLCKKGRMENFAGVGKRINRMS